MLLLLLIYPSVGWRRKVLKLHSLKCPKTVPKKWNLDQKVNDSKRYIWSLSLIFRFSNRKSQRQQTLAKKITHFTIQFRSKNLTHFTHSTQHNRKLTHFIQMFHQTCFWLVSEKTCALHHLHRCSRNWKANVSMFLYISVRKFLF